MKTVTPRWLAGGCTCGAVAYRVADAFEYALNCHCSGCRKATGSAFKSFGGIARDRLEMLSGPEKLRLFGDTDNHDARCATCGSFLYSVVRDGAYVHVAYGSLTNSPGRPPEAHIFVGSKAPWFKITDDLPQFEEFPV